MGKRRKRVSEKRQTGIGRRSMVEVIWMGIVRRGSWLWWRGHKDEQELCHWQCCISQESINLLEIGVSRLGSSKGLGHLNFRQFSPSQNTVTSNSTKMNLSLGQTTNQLSTKQQTTIQIQIFNTSFRSGSSRLSLLHFLLLFYQIYRS